MYRLLFRQTKIGLMLAMACMLIGALASCGGGATQATNGPVTINVWEWTPNFQDVVNLFEKSHPNIKVKLSNVGSGNAEYTKLTTALKAGSGAPDVVQIEYAYLPQYEIGNNLVDLTPYSANDVQNDFVPWVWQQVAQGGKIYGIPQDSGPMGLLYRTDVFEKYHLAVPTTWAQFAQEAVQLHKANPKLYLTDFPPSNGNWITSLIWQAGGQPFKVNGTNLTISLDSPQALQVVDYWGPLVKAGVVATTPDFTNDWYAGLQDGTIASWVTAAWAPVDLEGFAAKSAGKWHAALLPQWTEGGQASANWGGSACAVTNQSKYPAQAAEFAKWISTNEQSATLMSTKLNLFPTQKSVLSSSSFNTTNSFYGNQNVNAVFSQSSNNVNTSFQWSPFQDYVVTQLQNQIASAVQGKISFDQAMHNAQSTVVSYAKSQGFTVNGG